MYLGHVECYDPLLKRWTQRQSLNVPRSFIVTTMLGGMLYALGEFMILCIWVMLNAMILY